MDWFGSDSADRGEERANYQQQACCEPNMASRKRTAARRAKPRRGHVLRSRRTLPSASSARHGFQRRDMNPSLMSSVPVCRNSMDILDIFQLRGESGFGGPDVSGHPAAPGCAQPRSPSCFVATWLKALPASLSTRSGRWRSLGSNERRAADHPPTHPSSRQHLCWITRGSLDGGQLSCQPGGRRRRHTGPGWC